MDERKTKKKTADDAARKMLCHHLNKAPERLDGGDFEVFYARFPSARFKYTQPMTQKNQCRIFFEVDRAEALRVLEEEEVAEEKRVQDRVRELAKEKLETSRRKRKALADEAEALKKEEQVAA